MAARKDERAHGRKLCVHRINLFLKQRDIICMQSGDLDFCVSRLSGQHGSDREQPVLNVKQHVLSGAINFLIAQQSNPGVQLIDGTIAVNPDVCLGDTFPSKQRSSSLIAGFGVNLHGQKLLVRCGRSLARAIHVVVPAIPFYKSVAETDDAMSIMGDIIFVRNHDDRVTFIMQLLEEIHDIV